MSRRRNRRIIFWRKLFRVFVFCDRFEFADLYHLYIAIVIILQYHYYWLIAYQQYHQWVFPWPKKSYVSTPNININIHKIFLQLFIYVGEPLWIRKKKLLTYVSRRIWMFHFCLTFTPVNLHSHILPAVRLSMTVAEVAVSKSESHLLL